ncbi:hypothetical protein CfE428DRAFT_4968 [Chthoniobacter flavus Ellin428]|uniref:NlpC/P60 domain-containing protein n=1 Tax=Chthoniobacter flavus Ellin428 TaxID=497964 RepID=B4D7S8_9BACT|nr:hypothetical protein [Chthoniobacter flavus]EDY17451.1 hypothetical protein CfE428DRAFT_4968 [Chthoniobacter flavus Ellin428]TCO92250.1 hypothetical protein EV701_10618 [Chthoniobacter flavus]
MSPLKHSPRRLTAVYYSTGLIMSVMLICAVHFAVIAWMWHRATPARTFVDRLSGPLVSREEVLSIAQSYAEHPWTAAAQNVRHGVDAHGIDVQTPDGPANKAVPGKWRVGLENVGLPYKWGGFDTPESFDAGVAAGKAAGDVYTIGKRRRGNAAVSDEAVGIDCSGFISRCWKLPEKYGTATLPGLCNALKSTDDLLPGDVMDAPNGHVVLFVRWLDGAKFRALFYEAEAEPKPKVVLSEHNLLWLRFCGARPFRFALIGE